MSDIFLSYARSDRHRAAKLVRALERRGLTVWWDPEITPGKAFDDVIAAALERAKCVLVLWSVDSVGSSWVREEASEGLGRGVLVPALLDAVTLPLGFRRIQAASLVGWDGDASDPELERLIHALGSHVVVRESEDPADPVRPATAAAHARSSPAGTAPPPRPDVRSGSAPLYELVHAFDSGGDFIKDLAFSPDGRLLAVAGSCREDWYGALRTDGVVRIWDVDDEVLMQSLKDKRDERFDAVVFGPDGTTVVVGARAARDAPDAASVKTWDRRTASVRETLLTIEKGTISYVGFTPEGRVVVQGNEDRPGSSWVHSLDPGAAAEANPATPDGAANTVGTEGRFLGTIMNDRLTVWDGANSAPLAKDIELDFDWQLPIAFHPHGLRVAVGNSPRGQDFVMVLDLPSGDVRTAIPVPRNPGLLAFSPDARCLASTGEYGTVRLWDPETGEGKGRLGANEVGRMTRALAFDRDGRLLAVADQETISVYRRT